MCGRDHGAGRQQAAAVRAASEPAAAEGLDRRRVLVLAGGSVAVGLAGCLGGDGGDRPDPISLTDADRCEVCGMVIPVHPGPSAQVFYADNQPSGHENPARFDSTWEAFQYDFERQDRGWDREAFYVTDYSSVDWELDQQGGDTVITRHVGADTFVAAGDVTFVVDSAVVGTMGADLIAFSDDADAEAFQADHGGDLLELGDVTRETIAALGME